MRKIYQVGIGIAAAIMTMGGVGETVWMDHEVVWAAESDFVIENGVLTKYQGNGGDVLIPSGVTTISGNAFVFNKNVVSVVIPESVTCIEGGAFEYCENLTAVTIPNGVTSIGSWAFYRCEKLDSITIPASVNTIGEWALGNCSSLSSIVVDEKNPVYDSRNTCNAIIETATGEVVAGCQSSILPNGVTSIGSGAFIGCTGLTAISFPTSLTSIGYQAFTNCSGLTSIRIPKNVTSIVNPAFDGCSGLKSIVVNKENTVFDSRNNCNAIIRSADHTLVLGCQSTVIPSDVEYIEDYAFNGSRIKELSLPAGLKGLGNAVFQDCTELVSFEVPYGMTRIGHDMFNGCSSLERVSLPASVTEIDFQVFNGCVNLKSLDIPAGVTSIGSSAFARCKSLEKITLPAGLTEIEDALFHGCSSLTSVTIPYGVTSIGMHAFNGCTNLKSVTIPSTVSSIGIQSFYECGELESIVIPEGVTEIGDWTFDYCYKLSKVVIPSTVTHIGEQAFNGCYNAKFTINSKSLMVEPYAVPRLTVNLGSSTGGGSSNIDLVDGVIFIGDVLVKYNRSVSEYVVPSNVTGISSGAFEHCENLKKVTIPSSVKTIGVAAFYGCSNLETVVLKEGVETIQWIAFKYCRSLKSITIPASVTDIGSEAFAAYSDKFVEIVVDANNKVYDSRNNCNAIIETASSTLKQGCNTTVIPNSITAIGYDAFEGCEGMKQLVIPSRVKEIASGAFVDCKSLTEIVLPKKLTMFGGGVFAGCSGLKEIQLPEGVISLESASFFDYDFFGSGDIGMFTGCRSLETVILPNTLQTISWGAFQSCTSLKDVVIPEGVTSIEAYAFDSCASLKHLVLPEGVTSIQPGAFMNTTLDYLVLPKSLEYVDFYFLFDANIKDICYSGTKDEWKKIDTGWGDEDINDCIPSGTTVHYGHKIVAMPIVEATYTQTGLAGGRHCAICGRVTKKPTATPIKELPFTDVKLGGWQETTVRFVLDNNLMSGKTATTFDPNTTMNRGQLVSVLWSMAGKPRVTGDMPFADVASTNTFYKAILWASQNKIVNGYANGAFGPKDSLTRQQIATILMNYAKYCGVTIANKADLSSFKDVADVSKAMTTAMQWAVGNKIISGKNSGTMLDPKGMASRIEVAAMVMNYCKKIG